LKIYPKLPRCEIIFFTVDNVEETFDETQEEDLQILSESLVGNLTERRKIFQSLLEKSIAEAKEIQVFNHSAIFKILLTWNVGKISL
jgi:hypothetical protein